MLATYKGKGIVTAELSNGEIKEVETYIESVGYYRGWLEDGGNGYDKFWLEEFDVSPHDIVVPHPNEYTPHIHGLAIERIIDSSKIDWELEEIIDE